MDLNENNKDNKTLDNSNEMEVSDSNIQDKEKEESLDKMDSEETIAEVNNSSKNIESIAEKTVETENENTTTNSQNSNNNESNITQHDSEMTVEEKNNDHEDLAMVTNNINKLETSNIDTTDSLEISALPPREGKRKRKSMASSETPSDEQALPAAVEQNGSDSASKRKKLDNATKSDSYCWRCHKESVEALCSACPRSWHRRCMGGAPPLCVNNWICAECANILQAENAETRSPAMADITVDQLCLMLKYVVERMREQTGSQPFLKAVDTKEVPNYLDYIIKPMDLSLLESNVRAKLYGSTDAFMADAKWIQHNCIIFNTYTSKLTNTAKQMLKVARQEVAEIESCPDCFAHGRNIPRHVPSWFIEPCRRPHSIVWAKLKGFPFWPAKALPKLNTQGLVDVRFFGEHDRAWVSSNNIYLYSQEPPAVLPKKTKFEMEQCMQEVEDHIKRLKDTFGEFRYAPLKVLYDPHDPMQIQTLLPTYDPSKYIQTQTIKPEVQTPVVNSKTESPKAEKQPQNQKNTEVTSTNGVKESPVDKSKLVRKKKVTSSPDKTVNTSTDEIEIIDTIENHKDKSSPTSTVNNNNSEPIKVSNKSEINNVIDISNTDSSTKNISPVKKIKAVAVRKIKLASELSNEIRTKTNVSAKTSNGKVATVINVSSGLNNLKVNAEEFKSISPGQKPKTLYIQSNMKKVARLMPINQKVATKSPQTLGNKVIQKSLNKSAIEQKKLLVNNIQKTKNDLLSRPMTAIPVSAKKDQSKAMYLMMNSNASESAKHFSNKEVAQLILPVATIKQEPKEDDQPKLIITRKPSKARKSFPNRMSTSPPAKTSNSTVSHLSLLNHTKSKAGTANNTGDATVYIPSQHNNEARSTRASFELPPPEAGPATALIHQNSKDLAGRVAQLISDTIKEAAENNGVGSSSLINHHEATIHYLKLRMERMKWEHQQEINELKHNNELVVRELKASMEVERYRVLQDARREAEIDKLRSIEETKRKQWCVVCGREAMFYCCWNTAYCDYPCQQKHWSSHIANCAQKSQSQTNQSPQNENPTSQQLLQKSMAKTQQNGNTCNDSQILTADSA